MGGLLQSMSVHDAPQELIDGVLSALRWHPTVYKVVSGVCNALRLILEPRGGHERAASNGSVVRTVGGLRARNLLEGIDSILADFGTMDDKVLFENTWYVLGLVAGIKAVLLKLRVSDKACVSLRSGSLSVLFELERTFPHYFDITQLAEIHSLASSMARKTTIVDPGCILTIESAELIRCAELLCGASKALSHIRLVRLDVYLCELLP